MVHSRRYGNQTFVRRTSGTRRAIRQRQWIMAIGAAIICILLVIVCYSALSEPVPHLLDVGENKEEQITDMGEQNDIVGPHGLYTNSYLDGLTEDDLWMEDFEDTRTPEVVKAVYLTTDSINKKLDKIIELLDATELNAVVIDIKNDDGYITVKTESYSMNALGNVNPMIYNS